MEANGPQGVANLDPSGMVGTIYVGDHQILISIYAVALMVIYKKMLKVFPIICL